MTYGIYATETHAVQCTCDECLVFWHTYHLHEPGEPTCPLCTGEAMPHHSVVQRMEHCYKCNEPHAVTGRARLVGRADPTQVVELTCGHWVL